MPPTPHGPLPFPARLASRRRARAGFTLVEVAAALLLLAISAAIIIPELGQITDANVKSQAGQLVGVIEYANTQAVTRRNFYRLWFDIDKQHYWLEGRNTKGKFVPLASLIGKKRPLEDGVVYKDLYIAGTLYTKGVTYLEFFPDGTTDRGLIHLESLNGDEYTVEIDDYMASGEVIPGYTTPEQYDPDRGERGK